MMTTVDLKLNVYDNIDKIVTRSGKGAHVIVRSTWIDKNCIVMLLEPLTEEKANVTKHGLLRITESVSLSMFGSVHERVTKTGDGGHMTVPSAWIGKKVIAMLIEPRVGDLTNNTYEEKMPDTPVTEKYVATCKKEEDKQTPVKKGIEWGEPF